MILRHAAEMVPGQRWPRSLPPFKRSALATTKLMIRHRDSGDQRRHKPMIAIGTATTL